MSYRTVHTATYLYPGSFMPEEVQRRIPAPTFEAAVAYGPDDEHGYFQKDGWYAVRISSQLEQHYHASYGSASVWVPEGKPTVESFIVGTKVHYTDPSIAGEQFRILRSNIEGNSKDGYGIRTRVGNWQLTSGWDRVVAP